MVSVAVIAGAGNRLYVDDTGGGDPGGQFVEPEILPLEITSPRSDLPSGHRMTVQHPSVPYNVRAVVVHGAYPFTYALTANVPSGMTVDPDTGVISWASPTTGTHSNIELTVTDADGAVETETWTLVVGTSGHFFVDNTGAGSNSNDGSFATPWATLDHAYTNASANSVVWIKGGGDIYVLDDFTPTGGEENPLEWKIVWDNGSTSTIWLGYGASKPHIDFEHDGTFCSNFPTCTGMRPTPRFRLQGGTSYVDNIEFSNSFIQAFQMDADGGTAGWQVRRCIFNNHGPGFSGSNSAIVMSTHSAVTRYGSYFGENTVNGLEGFGSTTDNKSDAVKLYEENMALVADNVSTDDSFFGTDGVIAVKGGLLTNIDVRCNDITTVGAGLGGNQDGADNIVFRFNLIRTSGTHPVTSVAPNAFITNVGSDSSTNIWLVRNTFVNGRIQIDSGAAAVGPYTLRRNVIVNEDDGQLIPHVCDGEPGTSGWGDCAGLSDTDTIVMEDNLTGNASDGIVDAGGVLQGSYMTEFGPTTATPRGHQYA